MKNVSKEISALIKKQILDFDKKVESNDVGVVVSIGDGVATIYGLDDVMLGELVQFPHDIYGMVLNLEEESVGVVLLGDDTFIKEGDTVKRLKEVVEVPVGDALIGRVVNALGAPLDGKGQIKSERHRPIERIAPLVMTRESVNTPLLTGIKAIDAMIPIGRGQRELIIGDRQTGKTAIAIDTILAQKDQNVKCIYVAIGQKNSSIASIIHRLDTSGALAYTTVVSSSASELAPMQYIAPYSGMAIAEEFLEKGEDVLIVFDDLSKHAVAYRTLSLLLKRPSGREAYPGDVFYLHSRLLERACKLNKENGGGSITALPIIETQQGDISAYIPTNVISITDGQIFLLTDMFNAGFRPAIDSGLSVSRVGSSAQYKVMKQVSGSLRTELASFKELESFSQFGSDLDENTKNILAHGRVLMEVLKQDQYDIYSLDRQTIELFVAKNNYLDKYPLSRIKPILKDLYKYIVSTDNQLIKDIVSTHVLSNENENKLRSLVEDYLATLEVD